MRRYSLGSICDIDIPQLSEEIELKCAELKQELDDFDEDDRYFMVKKPSSIFPGETIETEGDMKPEFKRITINITNLGKI